MFIGHGVEENIFAGELADDRDAQRGAECFRQADEHEVGEGDDLRTNVVAEEVEEAAEFFACAAGVAAEDVFGEAGDFGGRGLRAEGARGGKKPGAVEEPVDEARGMAEEGGGVLEIDVDPAVGS